MTDNISMELFNRRFEQLNEMHRELRQDIRALGESMLQLSRQVSNLDRRITDVKEELEGTIKIEMGGAFAHLRDPARTSDRSPVVRSPAAQPV
jgi:hypothetical protein